MGKPKAKRPFIRILPPNKHSGCKVTDHLAVATIFAALTALAVAAAWASAAKGYWVLTFIVGVMAAAFGLLTVLYGIAMRQHTTRDLTD